MSPLFALEDVRVHICSTDSGNVSSNIETSVDKHFCILTTLRVPNIYPDNCYVRFRRGLDNPWSGSE